MFDNRAADIEKKIVLLEVKEKCFHVLVFPLKKIKSVTTNKRIHPKV